MNGWDPFIQEFRPPEPGRQAATPDSRAELARAVFHTPAGQALLREWRAELQAPAYRPGETLDQVAHIEGRRDLMREIIRQTETGES